MKLLVPLDGSSKSEAVLPLAGLLSERWQAQVLALRVIDPTLGSGTDPLVASLSRSAYEQMLKDADDYLTDLKQRFPQLALQAAQVVGEPGSTIQEVATREECELILMSTHGHSGLGRWIWGSVAEGVARHAPCPTMLVRSPQTPMVFRSILVPTDGSEASLEVTRHIGRFLAPETRVCLLYCGEAERAPQDDMRRAADGRPWMRQEIRKAPAPQGILDWLAENDCDLVAIFTHGRDGLSHLWKGSIAEETARNSTCPVLVFGPNTPAMKLTGGQAL